MPMFASQALKLVARDDGSQVVEYALVIALLAVVLAIALSNTATGIGSTFTDLANRVIACLSPGKKTC